MKAKIFLPLAILVLGVVSANAQYSAPPPVAVSSDAIASIAAELANISRNVQAMNERLKSVMDKTNSNVPASATLSDPRQKILVGIQALAGAEQRVIQLQASQFDLTQRLNDTRGKLSQTDIDLRPRNIDRSVVFEGTTETEELRESRRQKLNSDKQNLTQLFQQLQISLTETSDQLRDAQGFANRLRRQYLPQMEREMVDQ